MNVLQWVLLIVIILVALATACHALLYKRDPRAALGWITVCLLYPLVGLILCFLFDFKGENAIHHHGLALSSPKSVNPL